MSSNHIDKSISFQPITIDSQRSSNTSDFAAEDLSIASDEQHGHNHSHTHSTNTKNTCPTPIHSNQAPSTTPTNTTMTQSTSASGSAAARPVKCRFLSILLLVLLPIAAFLGPWGPKQLLASTNGPDVYSSFPNYAPVQTQTHDTTTRTNTNDSNMKDKDKDTGSSSSSSKSSSSSWSSSLMSSSTVAASDLLQCKKTVKEYVINATDVNDECDGLRKAFDKTCSSGGSSSSHHHRSHEQKDEKKKNRQRQQRRRRLLAPVLRPPPPNDDYTTNTKEEEALEVKLSRKLRYFYKRYIRPRRSTYESMFFFLDEQVTDPQRWKDVSSDVHRNYDLTEEYRGKVHQMMNGYVRDEEEKHPSSSSSKKNKNSNDNIVPHRKLSSSIIETNSQDEESKTANEDSNNNNKKSQSEDSHDDKEKHHVSPALPTSSEHIDNQMLNDAVALTNEQTDQIVEIMEQLENNTIAASSSSSSSSALSNASKSSSSSSISNNAANEDNEKAAKAISTATELVSAVLNSPESKEARTCCASILEIYHEECDVPDDEEYNDRRLFIIVCVIALCGLVKSLIRHYKVRWLPEAAGCILVGVVGGFFLQFLPHVDFGFHHDVFLRLMVPPIVFEAALNIDKRSFMRMAGPIFIYAVFGTLFSTILTAGFVYYGSQMVTTTAIPFIESLLFGALISSIDPIAVLSVLSNIGMSDKDAIYVLIFGESLLNDGVSIVLFQTLVEFLDENLVIDGEAVWIGAIQFLVIAFGSVFVGLASGACAAVYFYLMKGIQTPLVEVLMFLCWAFIPYYICDGIEWSGIVSIVSAGFFMDIYVVGSRIDLESDSQHVNSNSNSSSVEKSPCLPEEINTCQRSLFRTVFSQEGTLSNKAKTHIGFVTEINATLMETAIFSYLGIFLFSKRYHWNFWIPTISILACVMSRTIMITSLSCMVNFFNRLSRRRPCAQPGIMESQIPSIIDYKMQIVLVFAGLRGGMSFALVETLPLYDSSTGQGTRLKPELKSMTSAAIVFTVFILGGYTYYLLERLGLASGVKDHKSNNVEFTSLLEMENGNGASKHSEDDGICMSLSQGRTSPSNDSLKFRHSRGESS